jgi:hypothetical protein
MRRRWTVVAELLDPYRPQAGSREGIDLGTGQRPRRTVVGIAALVAGARDNTRRRASNAARRLGGLGEPSPGRAETD